jgi:hypothetical protein
VTKWNCCTAVFGFYAAFVVSAQARAETPAWLQLAAGTSPLASGTHATVLLDEVNVTVGTDGKARTVRRYAVRIHDSDGRDAAAVREVYVSGSGNVRSMRGWLLRRSNQTRELGGGNIVDAALFGHLMMCPMETYSEPRLRVKNGSCSPSLNGRFRIGGRSSWHGEQ